ncbi:hypothetical protein BDV11DRAFT_181390 [Aspergillus similis]
MLSHARVLRRTRLYGSSAGVQALAWVNIIRRILANIVTIFRCAAAIGHEQKRKRLWKNDSTKNLDLIRLSDNHPKFGINSECEIWRSLLPQSTSTSLHGSTKSPTCSNEDSLGIGLVYSNLAM